MNRAIDDAEEVAEDLVRGALLARPDLLAGTDNPRVVRRAGAADGLEATRGMAARLGELR